jgi:hypothetical protein
MRTAIRFVSTKEHILHIEFIKDRENDLTNTDFLIDNTSKIIFHQSTLLHLSFSVELLSLLLFLSFLFI